MHSVGNVERNLLAVEVKPGTAESPKIKKDIETLISCLKQANYSYGMLLIYGGCSPKWLGKVKRLAGQNTEFRAFRNRLLVYWHEAAGDSAFAVTWDEIMGT